MNKIRNVEIQVNEAKDIMKGNINEMASWIVKIQELEDKSDDLNKNALECHKAMKKTRCLTI